MTSPGQTENAILAKCMLTIDGTIGCVKSDTWCQRRFGTTFGTGPYLPVLLVMHELYSSLSPVLEREVWAN